MMNAIYTYSYPLFARINSNNKRQLIVSMIDFAEAPNQ